MESVTRRSFHRHMLGSLMAYGLIETLFRRDLLAAEVQPIVQKWLGELNELSMDLKGQKVSDLDFQAKLEDLYRRVDLPELLKLVEWERIDREAQLPDKGAANLGIDLRKVEGLPKLVVFGKQIFACKKGRSIVPHGHDNMCTGFVILHGEWQGKHYDRKEDHPDHYLIQPTIDRRFSPGEYSTVSDHKDNVHWFQAVSDKAYIFNIHVMGYNPENPKRSTRVYVDPDGDKTAGGLIVAKKISSSEAHRKYG